MSDGARGIMKDEGAKLYTVYHMDFEERKAELVPFGTHAARVLQISDENLWADLSKLFRERGENTEQVWITVCIEKIATNELITGYVKHTQEGLISNVDFLPEHTEKSRSDAGRQDHKEGSTGAQEIRANDTISNPRDSNKADRLFTVEKLMFETQELQDYYRRMHFEPRALADFMSKLPRTAADLLPRHILKLDAGEAIISKSERLNDRVQLLLMLNNGETRDLTLKLEKDIATMSVVAPCKVFTVTGFDVSNKRLKVEQTGGGPDLTVSLTDEAMFIDLMNFILDEGGKGLVAISACFLETQNSVWLVAYRKHQQKKCSISAVFAA